jgi:adenylate cyclase
VSETGEVGPCRILFTAERRRVVRTLSGPRVTLGRAATCDVVFPDSVTGISRHHATLVRDADGWWIEDAKSRNGTYLNGELVERQRLVDDDVIGLGPQPVIFEMVRPVERFPSPAASGPNVVFDDTPAAVSAALNVVEASRRLRAAGPSITEILQPGDADAGRTLRPLGRIPDSTAMNQPAADPTASGSSGSGSGLQVPGEALGFELFQQLGEALLKRQALAEVLDRVLSLALRQVPAQHGVICECGSRPDEYRVLISKIVGAIGSGRPGSAGSGEVRFSRSIANLSVASRQSLLVGGKAGADMPWEAQSIFSQNITSAMCVPLYNDQDGSVGGVIYVDSRDGDAPFTPEHLDVLTTMALFSSVAIEQAKLREAIAAEQQSRAILIRYLPESVVDDLIERRRTDDLVTNEREVSVLFADLCGFTALSQTLTAVEVVRLLNGVFENCAEVLFRYDGTLDKFMGDGLLAFFGAPLENADHAGSAVRAALEMQSRIEAHNLTLPADRRVSLRIGINTGPVVFGDIGTARRRDYTVIGDTVNVASRLESAIAKSGEVIIGPETRARVGDEFECLPLPAVQLPKRPGIIQPYRAVSVKATPAAAVPGGE